MAHCQHEHHTLNQAILMDLVVRALPNLSVQFTGMMQIAETLAEQMKGTADKEITARIMPELLAFGEFAFINNVYSLEEQFPDEVHFTHTAIRKATMDWMDNAFPGVLKDIEDLDALINNLFKAVEKHMGDSVDVRIIAEHIAKRIYGRKKPSPDFLGDLTAWMFEYFSEMAQQYASIPQEAYPSAEREYPSGPKVKKLVKEIQKQNPVPVTLEPKLLKMLKANNFKVKKGQVFNMIDAQDSGNVNGIVGILDMGNDQLVGAPLAMLIIQDGHPLQKSVNEYKEECEQLERKQEG